MEKPLVIYRIVPIKPYTHTHTPTHTHKHTHTHTHMYTNGFNESNKLRSIMLCPLHHLSITLSLTYPNNFSAYNLHQIRQQDHILKVLKLNDSYSASDGGWLDFLTKQRQKFCALYPCIEEIFPLTQ